MTAEVKNEKSSTENTSKWGKLKNNKIVKIILLILKPLFLIMSLYVFVISLELMTSSFRLIAGTKASEIFDREILENPLAGLMIGVLVTVIVQSSSTSTSIIVSMVASGIIEVKPAIPIIMGANIGTSVTSTLVAFGQVADKEKFKLSFAGATVHDMFNILSVLILLPIEYGTGYLRKVSGLIVGDLSDYEDFTNSTLSNYTNSTTNSTKTINYVKIQNVEFLKVITEPVTKMIVQLDSKMLEKIAKNKNCCGENPQLLKHVCEKGPNGTVIKCKYLFESAQISETLIGVIILLISLMCLCICLILMVKILSSLFKGPVAKYLDKKINSDFPGPCKYFTGYFAILIGCVLTILMQSSSVFTSSLIPLVGVGIVKLERIFPLTLGSNIGTTVTGILASLASGATGVDFIYSLQIALCHTIFNITGILIWYPIPFLRNVPLFLAKKLGEISADYRWFALVYLIGVFFVTPLIIFGLSQAGVIAFWVILTPILLTIAFVIILNILQRYIPNRLPRKLKNWNFLPIYLRSLGLYDRILRKTICRCKKFNTVSDQEKDNNEMKEIVIEKDPKLFNC